MALITATVGVRDLITAVRVLWMPTPAEVALVVTIVQAIKAIDRADIALWRDAQGQWQGVLQGHTGPIPDALTRITKNWTRLRLPAPLENEREN